MATDIEAYRKAHSYKSLLRFITCGSVDDGNSTLVGRLLHESGPIFEDHMAALEAERGQGITIDVAHRFFSTDKRKFIVADIPGHEQYTRNVVTGASTADLAVILIDARKGVLTQTCRLSYLVSLFGVHQVVLAVNKMDLVDHSQQTFDAIESSYRDFAKRIGLEKIQAIPVSAVCGDNIVSASANMIWYRGPTLMHFLETVPTEDEDLMRAFRMPVQWVNRPNQEFRGLSGTIASGVVRPGDRVRVLPSGRESEVTRIVSSDGDLESAIEGQSVTLTLEDEVDVSRGDVISAAATPPQIADQFEATLIWMHDQPMLPGRKYAMKIGASNVAATVAPLKYRINVNTLDHMAAEKLELNDIGVVEMELDQPIVFQPYNENHALGGFILMDRVTNDTVGAGLLHFALRRADNVHWQALDVTQKVRARQKNQEPCLLWFTGLSGAGKSTIANLVENRLVSAGRHTYLLDGDNVRRGLNKDLGFTAQDRVENIRRVGEVAKLMVDAGLIVVASFISPFRSERRMVRDLFKAEEFIEVFIDTPLEVAEQRDPKGLYKKARRGELRNFTGIDSPYESPEQPEIRIDTTQMTAQQAADEIIQQLLKRGVLDKLDRVLQPSAT